MISSPKNIIIILHIEQSTNIVYNYIKTNRILEENMSKVCIIKCDSYETNEVSKAIAIAFKEFGVEKLFKENEKILLKPNLLSSKSPDKAVTTHPEVFRGVALAMKQYNVTLSYGDSPATESPEKAQRACGIESVAKELMIVPADFTTHVDVDYPEGILARKFQFVKAIEDTDGIISICKFKTHALTRFTGAMKNQFGLIPGTLKAKDHVRFPDITSFTQMLSDLNSCVKPRLFVMDAIIGMEGNGPANGTPRKIGLILVSDDPVAMDSVCVGIMGLDYKDVPAVMNGEKSKLGVADYSKIEVSIIDSPNDFTDVNQPLATTDLASKIVPLLTISDFKNAMDGGKAITKFSSIFGPFLKKSVLNRPVIVYDKCTKCKLCVKVCPVEPKAIEFSAKKQKIVYKYEKCIRCFCCQELCPHAAIVVKKAPFHFILGTPKKSK